MLEPEYFNNKADRMIELYQELEDFIFQDIAERLLKSQSVSGTADRLIWKLEQMGESRAEIMNKLSQLTGLSRRELKVLLQDAVMTSWVDDLSAFNTIGIEVVNPLENAVVMSVMDAEYRKCQGELENLTRTTMNQSQNDLARMLDEAEIRVASGVQSYSSAICEILDNYAGKGMVIDYPTGTRRSLEAAVRMCVVTSMNQTCAQITNQYIIEGKVEYVLVSAHLGARVQQKGQPYLAGHENWQGKVYKIRGSEPGYPNLAEMTGYDIDDNGNGKVVNPLGLHGYNCRHSHKPWDKDLKNPYVDENGNLVINSEESKKIYEKQQKQRAMERSIRKTKRELLMKQKEIDMTAEVDVKKMLQSDYDRLAYKLRKQNAVYNEFCEENGLQKQSDRLKVAGFKRAQASKATGRARAYEHWERRKQENSINSESRKSVAKDSSGVTINFKKSIGEESFSQNLSKVNPNYGKEAAFSDNCQRCVPTYEMRERGYDVTAKGKYLNYDPLADDYTLAWENPYHVSCYNGNGRTELEKYMSAFGNGARAEVRVSWKNANGIGHVFVAEQRNGKTVYYDPQSGVEDCQEYFDYAADGETSFVRIDNAEPSALIYECCEEVKR